jgi:hypothetical protein
MGRDDDVTVPNVALAGFCAWLHNPVSARDKDNQRLLMLIRDPEFDSRLQFIIVGAWFGAFSHEQPLKGFSYPGNFDPLLQWTP